MAEYEAFVLDRQLNRATGSSASGSWTLALAGSSSRQRRAVSIANNDVLSSTDSLYVYIVTGGATAPSGAGNTGSFVLGAGGSVLRPLNWNFDIYVRSSANTPPYVVEEYC